MLRANLKQHSWIVITVQWICAFGVLLHLYTVAFRTDGTGRGIVDLLFLVGFLLWSCLPYLIWIIVAILKEQPKPALGAILGTLAFDLYVHFSVFVAPESSTAALGLLFAPLWNLILFGPLGAVISWPILSIWEKKHNVP